MKARATLETKLAYVNPIFEVSLIELTQKIFLNIILRKILGKKSRKRNNFEAFFFLFELFCAFKT